MKPIAAVRNNTDVLLELIVESDITNISVFILFYESTHQLNQKAN